MVFGAVWGSGGRCDGPQMYELLVGGILGGILCANQERAGRRPGVCASQPAS